VVSGYLAVLLSLPAVLLFIAAHHLLAQGQ